MGAWVVELTKAVVSWPFAALVSAIVFMLLFKRPLYSAIDRLSGGRVGSLQVELGRQEGAVLRGDMPSERPSARSLEDAMRDLMRDFPLEVIGAAKSQDALMQELATLRTWLRFEKIYNLVFGSQIRLLDFLKGKGEQSAGRDQLYRFYAGATPPIVDYPFGSYLTFLLDMDLAVVDVQKHYRITPLGVDFLTYLRLCEYPQRPF